MADNLTQSVDQQIERAVLALRGANRIACMTGAGISAESGVPTFRDSGGLWENHRVEEVATPEAFARNPEMVWRFYQARRQGLLDVEPNPGHFALVEMATLCDRFTIVTQNVDGLHIIAGSEDVLCLHGDIWIDQCNTCRRQIRVSQLCPDLIRCDDCGGLMRPGVVWFGEILPAEVFDRAAQACAQADVMLVVGTSSVVYPAASLATWAKRSGALIIEVNPDVTPLTGHADVMVSAVAGEALPRIVQQWRQAL